MHKRILIADSGSTKTDWLILESGCEPVAHKTIGLNPYVMQSDDIVREVSNAFSANAAFDEVYFYGAGCRGNQLAVMENALGNALHLATPAHVHSDMLGAARAVSGDENSIVCILGTGSNSCLYKGGDIVANVSPLGFILGDEGSGAVLGKRLLGDVFKHQLPAPLADTFVKQYGLTIDDVVRRVYKEPLPNRFLASFVPFLAAHQSEPAVTALLKDEFSRFVQRNLKAYDGAQLPVCFVGGVAYCFQSLLAEVLQSNGFRMGSVIKAPMDGLARYHALG